MTITFFEIKEILESRMSTPYYLIQYLLSNDMLSKSLPTLLPSFYESPIYFDPTYKRNVKTGKFCLTKKKLKLFHVGRLPGYANRILATHE